VKRSVHLFVLCSLAIVSSTARAEIAILSSGKILYIDDYHREDKTVTMFLTGGGEVTVSSDVVLNVVPNEIVPEDTSRLAELPLLPQLSGVISPAAERYGLDPRLVAALIMVESSGDSRAVSRTGARGLMQLMPDTAKRMGVGDVFDPAQNVEAGVRYLKDMLDRHEQDLTLALAAYNAGPTAVARYGGIPPYPETQKYVRRVLELYEGS
jgi:hypothetical protein